MTVKDIINKIFWDKNEIKEDYSFFYADRITKKTTEIKGNQIISLDGNFIQMMKEGEFTEIPIHRIREVRKKGEIILKR